MVLHRDAIPPGPDPYERDVDRLYLSLRGHVVRPGDDRYDTARSIWNSAYAGSPALIVQPLDAQDVAHAVAFARDHDLPIAVRSGGHGMAGYGTNTGGLQIDLSLMKSIEIDPERRVARAETGLTWAEYAGYAAQYGLATSSGDMGSVGLGGLTLGGGIGWMARKHGLTIDHLLSAEVVTADGRILRASDRENPDLFWALRGGGGNFGVVTRLELRLQPAPLVIGGGVLYDPASAAEMLRAYSDYADSAPDELTTMAMMMEAPPAPFVPPEWQGKRMFAILICYSGDLDEGMRVVAPLRELGPVIADVISPMPYPVMFELSKEGGAPGFSHAVRTGFMYRLDDATIETIVERVARSTSPRSIVQLRVLGGAMSRVPQDATAFAHRDKHFMLGIYDSWDRAEDEAACRAWTTDFWHAIRPHTSGTYVNFLQDEGETRIREAYKPVTYRRLVDIKNLYDPDNVFHLNQNIRPTV